MEPNNEKKRFVGRPRSESSKLAILNSVKDLLETKGFTNLTIEGIAKEAGVSKATIYRWWKNKEMILLSLFLEVSQSKFEFDPDQSVVENLRQQMQELSHILDSTIGRALLLIIIENESISKEFHLHFLHPRRLEAKRILSVGIEKGLLQPNINMDIVLDLLFGPIYFKLMVYKESIDTNFINELIDQAMKGIIIHSSN
ncbi:TetR/AcrR family transcriptional regulator [Paenibacillus gallinarum]|uniref:TetR/AcrR family transcriptional regulator n=1 Tax=Paenibacillus gallinarum TaxID=2762232 RepID=A0ABR8SVM5_9BACL|nr:TetR/AcrR family transcriptional regulator [Paenibacillus gallinarum]MBD7967548.1 TetR/AcrR family transcriptional regulator [Paenibacillus gallinarum]